MIKHRIAQFIEKEHLIPARGKVLVTLSGGADSVALLRLLLALGYNCEAAHCNFHLRGAESDRDEAFVRALCERLGVVLHVASFDTYAHAAGRKISIEMAARELRYAWFAEVKAACGAQVVAVAHHRDDSVETMLLNLMRGTGITGLLGIRPVNGDIVRPLLCVSRQEIVDYLDHINQDYVTDSTNLTDDYTRNKIRLQLIPLMEEFNPSVKQSLADTAEHLSQVATLYNAYIGKEKEQVMGAQGIHIAGLLGMPSPGALLFEILHPLGFNASQIEDVLQALHGQSGKKFIGSTGIRVIKDREYLLIDKAGETDETTAPPFELHTEEHAYSPDFVMKRSKNLAYFDADKLKHSLSIRKWRHGDYFVPFGMRGRKLVSNYLTDRKLSVIQKDNQWVLCSGEDIVWLIGERTDNRFRLDENSKRVLVVRVKE